MIAFVSKCEECYERPFEEQAKCLSRIRICYFRQRQQKAAFTYTSYSEQTGIDTYNISYVQRL